MKITRPQDGEVCRYWRRKNGIVVIRTACCDCGLVHLEELTPRKMYIRIRVWRDEKLTKKMRGGRRVIGKK